MKRPVITLLFFIHCSAYAHDNWSNDNPQINIIFKQNASRFTDYPIPVAKVYDIPKFWLSYKGDCTDFNTGTYNEVFGKLSPKQFLAELIKVNQTEKNNNETGRAYRFIIPGGSLYLAADHYYATADENDELVSILVEGEERGRYPEGIQGVRTSDDLLCFFKGPRKGLCAIGDDTAE